MSPSSQAWDFFFCLTTNSIFSVDYSEHMILSWNHSRNPDHTISSVRKGHLLLFQHRGCCCPLMVSHVPRVRTYEWTTLILFTSTANQTVLFDSWLVGRTQDAWSLWSQVSWIWHEDLDLPSLHTPLTNQGTNVDLGAAPHADWRTVILKWKEGVIELKHVIAKPGQLRLKQNNRLNIWEYWVNWFSTFLHFVPLCCSVPYGNLHAWVMLLRVVTVRKMHYIPDVYISQRLMSRSKYQFSYNYWNQASWVQPVCRRIKPSGEWWVLL